MEYMGKNGFVWWQGVVEDIYDPLKLGRVRVRVLGWHTDDKTEIPTDNLPWAHVAMPVTASSVSGKGWSPTGILQGSWVIGFFRDGFAGQEPIVFGTVGGINTINIPVPDGIYETSQDPFLDPTNIRNAIAGEIQSKRNEILAKLEAEKNDVGKKPYEMSKNPTINTSRGFSDPEGVYPLISRMGEADTNRLARGEQIENTIVKKKNDSLVNCPTALYGFWTEPQSPYAAKYPFNNVYESQAGHVVEYDDTPGAERMHHYHCSGSFTEIHPLGSEVHKVVGNAWDITLNDKMILVKGNCSFNADKTLKILMGKDLEIEVFGDTRMLTRGDMTLDVGGNFLHKVGGTYTLASEGNMVMIAPRIDLNPEGENASSINTFLDRARSFVNGIIQKVSQITSAAGIEVPLEQKEQPKDELKATIIELTGKVQYRERPGEVWKSGRLGDVIFPGYEVRTGVKSKAVLKITEGDLTGTLSMEAGTMAKIPDAVSWSGEDIKTTVSVQTGRADFKVDRIGLTNDFAVVPPRSSLGVRG